MPIKYISYIPETTDGQAVLDNFTRTRRVLRYRELKTHSQPVKKLTVAQIGDMLSGDIHGLAVVQHDNATVFATTNKGLHRSDDGGLHWTFQPLESPWQYTRCIAARADGDGMLFLTNGNGPPGSTGRLLRSVDYGASWQDVGLPGSLNSTPWCVASHVSDPEVVFSVTNLGQLFRSLDGGLTWAKLPREFGEVRSMRLLA